MFRLASAAILSENTLHEWDGISSLLFWLDAAVA
jgi:hypothetical protein